MIILDTDHMTLLEWGQGEDAYRLRNRLQRVPALDRATTIITYEEQTRGWLAYVARARTPDQLVMAYRNLSKHVEIYQRTRVFPFDERAAGEFQRLRRSRLRIGTQDLKIAATVLSQGATLLSRNLSHFRQVTGLAVEDWTV